MAFYQEDENFTNNASVVAIQIHVDQLYGLEKLKMKNLFKFKYTSCKQQITQSGIFDRFYGSLLKFIILISMSQHYEKQKASTCFRCLIKLISLLLNQEFFFSFFLKFS